MSDRIADLTEAVRVREVARLAAAAAFGVARTRLRHTEIEEKTAQAELIEALTDEMETLTAQLERLQLMANR